MTHARKNWPSLVSLFAEAKFRHATCCGPWACCGDEPDFIFAGSQPGLGESGGRVNFVLDSDTSFHVRGPHTVIGLGSVIMLASWVAFEVWGMIAGLIVGVILLDFGEQGALTTPRRLARRTS
jgi:hypothetical protein